MKKRTHRKRADYPEPLTFNTSSGKPLSIAFEKGYCVGQIDIGLSGNLENNAVKVNLRASLWENEILALLNWFKDWREAHEHNNGPLERKMVRKTITMLVPA